MAVRVRESLHIQTGISLKPERGGVERPICPSSLPHNVKVLKRCVYGEEESAGVPQRWQRSLRPPARVLAGCAPLPRLRGSRRARCSHSSHSISDLFALTRSADFPSRRRRPRSHTRALAHPPAFSRPLSPRNGADAARFTFRVAASPRTSPAPRLSQVAGLRGGVVGGYALAGKEGGLRARPVSPARLPRSSGSVPPTRSSWTGPAAALSESLSNNSCPAAAPQSGLRVPQAEPHAAHPLSPRHPVLEGRETLGWPRPQSADAVTAQERRVRTPTPTTRAVPPASLL